MVHDVFQLNPIIPLTPGWYSVMIKVLISRWSPQSTAFTLCLYSAAPSNCEALAFITWNDKNLSLLSFGDIHKLTKSLVL